MRPQALAIGFFTAVVLVVALWVGRAQVANNVFQFVSPSGDVLVVDVVSAQMFRFEVFEAGQKPSLEEHALPNLMPQAVREPVRVQQEGDSLETPSFVINVTRDRLCLDVFDKAAGTSLVAICPGQEKAGFSLDAPLMTHAYGLGEEFSSQPVFSWAGRTRKPGHAMGNKMIDFEKGWVGNLQMSVLYALGKERQNFAFIFDNAHPQTWTLQNQPWQVQSTGGAKRGYFIGGRDLPELRRQLMDLTGHPPIPPHKAFGLWLSEFGFDNWQEADSKIKTLKANGFPLSGVVFDLQWFGNIKAGSEESQMGGLQWDTRNFPDPQGKIKSYANDGLGVMVIEEPYISRKVLDHESNEPVFDVLVRKGYLAIEGSQSGGAPVALDPKAWWGNGGMLDFVQPEAADFWHDWKRQPLIDMGLTGIWADLGEPEAYSPTAYYNQGRSPHAEIHNLYNFRWSESIARGFARHSVERRPWGLTRSGNLGSQRFGLAMWSGDIGSNLESLRAHQYVQSHMSLSGVDYFGSDVGGFHRSALRGNANEMYSQWFANSSLFDFPVRPHTLNLCNCLETAPDRIGYKDSNLANIKLRYALLPYYYSLAYSAFADGEPLVAPLIYRFQNDERVRELGDHKLIGPYLLAAAIFDENIKTKKVYLPKGVWTNFRTAEKVVSSGQTFEVAVRHGNVLQAPLFAREGAIIPMASGGGLDVRIYPAKFATEFTLYEDDGETVRYREGQRRTTSFHQVTEADRVKISVERAEGTFANAPETRALRLNVIGVAAAKSILLNGEALSHEKWKNWPSGVEVDLGAVSTQVPANVEIVFE